MKKPKCGKCKSSKIAFTEFYICTSHWDSGSAYDNGISRNGYPEYVIATCEDCDHAWRLRGVSQVDPEWFSRR